MAKAIDDRQRDKDLPAFPLCLIRGRKALSLLASFAGAWHLDWREMLYLQLPPSEGALANTLKENLLAKMFEEHLGFVHACEACKVPKQRALAELKLDPVFAEAVEQARELLAEYWHEEAVTLADQAKGREDTPAYTLAVQTRLKIADQVLPRLRAKRADKAAGNHLHLHQGDTFYMSEEKREALQAQRERLTIGRPDAHAPASIAKTEAPAPIEQAEPGDAVAGHAEPLPPVETIAKANYAENILRGEHKNEGNDEAPPGEGRG